MGFFPRSNSISFPSQGGRQRNDSIVSTSSTSRPSENDPSTESEQRFHKRGWFGSRSSSRASNGSSNPPEAFPIQRRAELASKSIPQRTSSKNATNDGAGHNRSNSLVGQLLSRGRSLTSSSSKLSIASFASASSVGSRRGSRSRPASQTRSSEAEVERESAVMLLLKS